jgi:hypothetical protein
MNKRINKLYITYLRKIKDMHMYIRVYYLFNTKLHIILCNVMYYLLTS